MDAERWDRRRERFERKRDRWDRRWERKRHESPGKHLFLGIVLVAVGGLFLLGNMGILDASDVFRYWPVILIAGGIVRLAENRGRCGQGSGMFWILAGAFFLSGSVGAFRLAVWNFWPILLIVLGGLTLWRNTTTHSPRSSGSGYDISPESAGNTRFTAAETGPALDAGATEGTGSASAEAAASAASSNAFVSAMAILGSVHRRNNSPDFRGGSATAVMGGCEIDLRAANIDGGREPVLEVFALWGGIEVIVPPDWTVVSHVDPILGGFEDSTQPPKQETKRFVIRGTAIMGGIEVSN